MPTALSNPTWDETTPASAIPAWNDTQPLPTPRQEEIKATPSLSEELKQTVSQGRINPIAAYNVLKHRLFPEEPAPYGVKPPEEPSLLGTTEEIPIDQTDTSPLGIAKGVGSATVNIGNKLMHGATTLKGIASLPLFLLPGAAEAYAVDTAAKVPQQFEAIKRTLETQGGAAAAQEATETGLSDAMAALPLLGRKAVAESTKSGVSKGLRAETTPKFEETTPATETAGTVEAKPLATPDLETGLPAGKAVTQRFRQPSGPEVEDAQMAGELGLPPEIEKPAVVSPESDTTPVVETGEPVEATQGPTGISAKAFERVYGEGEIPVGESMSPEEIFAQGQRDLAGGADPYALAAKARAGDVSPRELGLLAAEHHRLVSEAAAREGTPEYEAAYQQAHDFARNMLKPAGTRWHQMGMGLQVEAPIDYSNLTGFRRAVSERLGREMTPQEATAFKRIANDVARAGKEAQASAVEGANKAARHYAKVKDVPFDEAAKSVHEAIGEAVKQCGL